MKALKSIFLIFIMITSIGSNLVINETSLEINERKIENLRAFAKLYGYIRYFHPSDEAASIDWDKFIYYGTEQVAKAESPEDLMITLDSLFLPIAPTIDIFFAGETLKEFNQIENINDSVLVTWQHQGIGLTEGSSYKSIRIGRINWSADLTYGLYQLLKVDDYGNKKFKLSVDVKATQNSIGGIEVLYYTNLGESHKISKTFKNTEWDQLVLEDRFEAGVGYVFIALRLLEKGSVRFDNIEFQLETKEGNLQPFLISNNQFNLPLGFESQSSVGFSQTWESYDVWCEYDIETSEERTSLIIKNREGFRPGSLFEEHATSNDLITKDLNNNIKCRFPVALHLPRKQPEKLSNSFMNLKNKVDQVQLEENTANQEATRFGAIITAWNIFQHFYPYFDVIQTNWDSILIQALRETQFDQNREDCMVTLQKMTAALHDGHANVYHTIIKSMRELPARFDYVEDQIVVVATNCDQLQIGDILNEIDGKSAIKMLLEREELESGTPQWKRYKALRYFTLQDSNVISELLIERNDQMLNVSADRKAPVPEIIRPPNVAEIRDNLYYVNLCKATIMEIEEEIQEIANAKGVVFDLRGYPNENHDVISHMIDQPVQSPKWNIPQIIYPDQQGIVGYDTSYNWTIEPKQPKINGRIAFITNERAISYAETFMAFIEYYKLGEIIGSPTAGANGNTNPFNTLGGFRISWTGMKVLKQDYSQHHLIGIKPTIPLKPTIKGVREERDELLEKALEIISE